MIRRFIIRCYLVLHDIAFKTIRWNPYIKKRINSRQVRYGFISNEHLKNPQLDEQLVHALQQAGIEVRDYRIDIKGYQEYLRRTRYPEDYHGGSAKKKDSFAEKSLEHYVSADLLGFTPRDVYVDIASRRSPFYKIVSDLWHPSKVYRQDLAFKSGLHGDTIGGSAAHLPLSPNSITKATLHCSLEHFEGDSDFELFREMGRVLRPGGKFCVLPFYLAREYTIHTDPIYDIFFGRGLQFDPDAQIRYCSWNIRHSRHYDIARLQSRIVKNLQQLELTVYRVLNFREVHPDSYLRFIGLFEKTK